MMGIGTGELLLIMLVALIVLGPEKMPVYAKKAGRAFSSLKSYAGKLSEEINENIVEPLEEVKKPLEKVSDPLTNITKDINKQMEDVKNSVNDINKPQSKDEAAAAEGVSTEAPAESE